MSAGTFRKRIHVGLYLEITILYSSDLFITYSLIFLKDMNKSIDKDIIYNGLKTRYFSKVVLLYFPVNSKPESYEYETGVMIR